MRSATLQYSCSPLAVDSLVALPLLPNPSGTTAMAGTTSRQPWESPALSSIWSAPSVSLSGPLGGSQHAWQQVATSGLSGAANGSPTALGPRGVTSVCASTPRRSPSACAGGLPGRACAAGFCLRLLEADGCAHSLLFSRAPFFSGGMAGRPFGAFEIRTPQ